MVVMDAEQWIPFNAKVIEEFRANGGRCGGYLEGNPLVLVTATGARSGEPRTIPLTFHELDGRIFVAASAGGAPEAPAWYHNRRANPRVVVELGRERFDADIRQLESVERDAIWARIASGEPRFAEYQESVERVIPLLEIVRA